MYERFYGLRELPFELTIDPRFVFLTSQHREALSNLEYGLSSAKSITALVGEAGTGKTTLIRKALESERCRRVQCVYLNNPTLTRDEFVQLVATRFGLSRSAGESKAVLLDELEKLLYARRERGEITALVIDEAQSLTTELLEEVRLLANLETASQKLLPLVLAGQPELAERLNDPALRQLKQRVALRCELRPFELSETAAYIASRVRTAGGEPFRVFTREAVTLIHERSMGVARTVSVISDNTLASGFALGRKPVDSDIVAEVCRDFDLRGATIDTPSNSEQAVPIEAAPHEVGAEGESAEVSSIAPKPLGTPARFSVLGSLR
jgi:general secretion pathway protein A